MNQLQLECTVNRMPGGLEFSCISLLPDEMRALDGKSIKIDGETIRFRLWNGTRLYVNQRRWTLGYFKLREWNLSWGSPVVAQLVGNQPSPVVAQAVKQLLEIDTCRLIEINS